SKSWNIILTFLVVVLYQGSGAWLSGMGKEGLMDPVLATWLPNIVFATVGLVLYLLLDTPIAYKLREFISRLFVIFLLIVTFSALTSTVGFSQENLIKVQAADTYFTPDSVLLKGEITIIWDKYKLLCDEALVILEENKVKFIEAKGNVKFYDEDRLYLSNTLKYEFETEKALILNAKTIYNYNYKNKKVPIYVYSSKVSYDSSNTSDVPISLEDSYITTCSFETPHYMILSSHVYVLENNYIIATNSFLVVLGIPIFPYPVFITALDGTPPYSFSIIFGQNITLNQSFAFTVNNWDVGLSFSNAGNIFKLQDKTIKNNKIIYDEAKKYVEFNISPVTYKYSEGNIYYKLDGPLYFEGNYISSSNFYQRIGLNLQNQYLLFRPLITYDGRLTDTIIQLSGNIRNISYNFFDNHTLRINSFDSNFRLQTDGYINLERPYNLTYQNSYNITIFNNNVGYNLLLYGNKTLNSENQNINYTYLLPWNWKQEPFSIDFQYQFLIKGLSSTSNDVKKQTIGMSDKYTIIGTYSLGPFKLTSQWEQVYNFIDEATSNNRNNLKISVDVTTPNIRISNVRTYDILKNKQLPDSVTISAKQPFGDLELSNSITFSYDNENNKLGNQNITFGLNLKSLNAFYTLQFTIQPGRPIESYIHSIKWSNFTITAQQYTDYLRSLTANGVLDLFDYKATLKANYSQSSRTAEPKWNFSYTMEKKDEKYTLSYNTDGKNNYKFEASIKNIDPQLILGLTYNPNTNSIDFLTLNLDKSLHCWRLNFGLELVNRNTGSFFDNISKVSFKFYLTDIEDKFFLLEPKSGKFEVGGF
ncbi:MAG: YjgP/YjgQ family permease, partial [Fervidobacterium sp.]